MSSLKYEIDCFEFSRIQQGWTIYYHRKDGFGVEFRTAKGIDEESDQILFTDGTSKRYPECYLTKWAAEKSHPLYQTAEEREWEDAMLAHDSICRVRNLIKEGKIPTIEEREKQGKGPGIRIPADRPFGGKK